MTAPSEWRNTAPLKNMVALVYYLGRYTLAQWNVGSQVWTLDNGVGWVAAEEDLWWVPLPMPPSPDSPPNPAAVD